MWFYCILFIWNWLCKWGKVGIYFHFLSKWVFVVQPWLNTTCVICQMAICATDLVNQFLPSLFYSTGLHQCLIQPRTVFITIAKSESGCLGGRVLPPLGFLPFYINFRSSTESLTGPVGVLLGLHGICGPVWGGTDMFTVGTLPYWMAVCRVFKRMVSNFLGLRSWLCSSLATSPRRMYLTLMDLHFLMY